jgi:phosphoglycerol transferase MdoB-like AlkP superfamily enzyme
MALSYAADKYMTTAIRAWPLVTFILLLICDRVIIGYPVSLSQGILFDLLLVSLVLVLSLERNGFVDIMQVMISGSIVFYYWLNIGVYSAIHFPLTWAGFIANYKDFYAISYFISTKLIIFTTLTLLVILSLRKKKLHLPMHHSASNLIALEVFIVLTISYNVVNVYHNKPNMTGEVLDLTTQSITANSVNQNVLNQLKTQYPIIDQRGQDYLNAGMPLSTHAKDKRNIIIVLSESLSAVDSKYSNGLFNRLPLIDKIQQDGLVFNNLAANGKISVQGMAALLLGVIATKTGGYSSIGEQFPPSALTAHNMIAYAKQNGYQTIAITSNPHHWQGADQWLKQIGFDTVLGPQSEELRHASHYTWDAPSDEALYHEALNIASRQNKPYLIFIETISLHPPYILPDKKYAITNNSLLNQVNYVDHTTHDFYQQLKLQQFFNNGLLVILGDHRRFEPLEAAETKKGGYAVWHERIVGTIVGADIKPHSICNTPYTTADLNQLLHKVIGGQRINDASLLASKITSQIGIDTPLNITLADESHGGYLIRSNEHKPLYISIYGDVPIDKIPYPAYQQAVLFLMLNDLWIKKTLHEDKA